MRGPKFLRMRKYLLLTILCTFFSCEEKKLEFFLSEPSGNLVLIKNYPEDDSLLKNIVKKNLVKNYHK